MRYPWIDEYLMSKPAVTRDLKTEWNWIRYMIGGKMFAAILLGDDNKPYYINMKLEPMFGETLRRAYPGEVIPGYYCNKVHWNSVVPDGSVPDELLRTMLDQACSLILKSLPKKTQHELLDSISR